MIIPQFLDYFLVKEINRLMGESTPSAFFEEIHGPLHSKGLLYTHNKQLNFIQNFLMNEISILEFFRKITAHDQMKSISTYIYKTDETARHALTWHQDLVDQRLFVISINLSMTAFEEGQFALRNVQSGEELLRLSNIGIGDLIVAQIGTDFEHCTTKVAGSNPRFTLAGWGLGYSSFEPKKFI